MHWFMEPPLYIFNPLFFHEEIMLSVTYITNLSLSLSQTLRSQRFCNSSGEARVIAARWIFTCIQR